MKPLKIEILADTLSLSKKDKVDVVVFGEKGLDLSKAKKESFVFGITETAAGSLRIHSDGGMRHSSIPESAPAQGTLISQPCAKVLP